MTKPVNPESMDGRSPSPAAEYAAVTGINEYSTDQLEEYQHYYHCLETLLLQYENVSYVILLVSDRARVQPCTANF